MSMTPFVSLRIISQTSIMRPAPGCVARNGVPIRIFQESHDRFTLDADNQSYDDIFRALSAVLGMPLPFNSLRQLRAAMYAEFPHLAQIDQIVPAGLDGIKELGGRATKTDNAKLHSPIGDFYLTNPIARNSAIMAECSQMQAGLKQAAE